MIRLFCTRCDDYHDQESQCPHYRRGASTPRPAKADAPAQPVVRAVPGGPSDHLLNKSCRIVPRPDISPDIAGRVGTVRKWMETDQVYHIEISGLKKPTYVRATDLEEVV